MLTTTCTYQERYTFSGKEKDSETGYHYFGARYYNSDLSLWLSVDPMADKYPSLSPYNYCAWNPMKIVDPDGEDTLVFNANGKYSHSIDAPGEHVGRFERSSCEIINFSFADPINDPDAVKNGSISRVCKVEDADIIEKLQKANVFDVKPRSYLSKFLYLANHSNASKNVGNLDFVISSGIDLGTLYIVENSKSKNPRNIAHNAYNFGNLLWGASSRILGVTLPQALIGAHVNNFLFDHENAGKKFWQRKFDSKDDQRSIRQGYLWAKKHTRMNK